MNRPRQIDSNRQGNNMENVNWTAKHHGNDVCQGNTRERVHDLTKSHGKCNFADVLPMKGRGACAASYFPVLSRRPARLQRGDIGLGNFS